MATPPPRHARRRRLGRADYTLLAEALASLAAASAAIRLLPFRRLVAAVARAPKRSRRPAGGARLRWAVRAWQRRVPWRAVCFQSALALQMMLKRRGVPSVLHYGIAREEGLKAHVWLSVDGATVMGGEEAPRFSEVAAFSSLPSAQ